MVYTTKDITSKFKNFSCVKTYNLKIIKLCKNDYLIEGEGVDCLKGNSFKRLMDVYTALNLLVSIEIIKANRLFLEQINTKIKEIEKLNNPLSYEYKKLMTDYEYNHKDGASYAMELLVMMDVNLPESEWTGKILTTLNQTYVIDKKFDINDIEAFMLKQEIIVNDYYTIYTDDSLNNHYIVYN